MTHLTVVPLCFVPDGEPTAIDYHITRTSVGRFSMAQARRMVDHICVAGAILTVLGCIQPTMPNRPSADVTIDLESIDVDGLRGSEGNKRAVAYEFKIPDKPDAREAVRRIDGSIEFMPGSRGRVGAGVGECLCIGSTHQAHYRRILTDLAALPFIERIIECDGE